MGFVACLRFSDAGGALLGDEESWHLRRNKTYVNDPVHALVDPADAERFGLDLVYAGAGTPGFHKMVVELARDRIAESLKKAPKTAGLLKLARLVNECVAEVHRAWRNNRLKLYFDFTIDDLTRGSFKADGKAVEIASDEVKKKARKIVNTNEDGGYHGKNHALLIGYDARGFNMFCLKAELGVLSYVSTGFDVLGKGVYGSAAKFRDRLENLPLKTRRAGLDRRDGLHTLLTAALGASEYYNEAGGNFHIALIDRGGKSAAARRIEVRDARARLAREIVWAELHGFVPREASLDLLDGLVFGNEALEAAEKALFAATPNPAHLELGLRGYKLDGELAVLATGRPAPKAPVPGGPRSRRKGVRA